MIIGWDRFSLSYTCEGWWSDREEERALEKRLRELPEVETGFGPRVGKIWLAFILIRDV
jgi:hypothetical protein